MEAGLTQKFCTIIYDLSAVPVSLTVLRLLSLTSRTAISWLIFGLCAMRLAFLGSMGLAALLILRGSGTTALCPAADRRALPRIPLAVAAFSYAVLDGASVHLYGQHHGFALLW